MRWTAIFIVLGALVLFGAGTQLFRWIRRQRAIRRIPQAERTRIARGVDIRVLLLGAPPFAGMHPTKLNRTRGDLVLSERRFLLTSGKGILADLSDDRGRRFSSVRCTGPGRLVIEGDVPRPDGTAGLYRFELVLEDAREWAEALGPWARGEGSYGSVPAELS